jgi:hypothetical protein
MSVLTIWKVACGGIEEIIAFCIQGHARRTRTGVGFRALAATVVVVNEPALTCPGSSRPAMTAFSVYPEV